MDEPPAVAPLAPDAFASSDSTRGAIRSEAPLLPRVGGQTLGPIGPQGSAVTAGPLRRTLLALAWPVLGEQLLNTLVGLFDVWLAGRISAVATSAVGIAAYVSWLVALTVMLIATGTTALVARFEGAGDHDEANRFGNQSITLAAVLGAALSVALFLSAPTLVRCFQMTESAYPVAVEYLRIDACGYLFMCVTLAGCAALRGTGNMRAPLLIFAVVNVVNIVASWSLVYPIGMGVTGIVGGTVTARVVGGLLLVCLLPRGRSGIQLRWPELRLVRDRAWRILRIGIPAGADGAVMWAGHVVFLSIVSRAAVGAIGQACFAAHMIAVRVEALTYLPATAWAAATATMVGQALGAGDTRRALRVGHEAVLQCGLLIAVVVAFFVLEAPWIYAQMSVDPLVHAAGVRPFRILSVLQPCMVVSIIYIEGLRGAGDTRNPLLITMVGMLLRITVGFYFGLVEQLGLVGAWMGMFTDMVWRALAAAVHYIPGRWVSTKV
jgi:putative MATE family efflux protein